MATIIGMIANDHPRDGGHPWDRLKNFDNFWDGDPPGDSEHAMDGDHPRNADHPRDGGCLNVFYHPKGWLINFGSVESWFPPKSD